MVKYGDMSRKEAKTSLSKILYGGRPDFDLPFLWALWGETQAAAQILLNNNEFDYLQDKFSDRRHPQATRLFYALSKFEDDALTQCTSDFKDSHSGSLVNAFIYDGFIGIPAETADQEDIEATLKTVSEQSAFSWAVEKM